MPSRFILRLSSISQKLWMASAGVFLLIFLVVHLCINLLMLLPDGGQTFNVASRFMASNLLVKIFEIVLIASFLLHIALGIILKIQNWMARPQRYAVSSKTPTSFFSRYTIWTGLTVLLVLIIHLINFNFVKEGWVPMPPGVNDPLDFYTMAILLFTNEVYVIIYYVWLVVLAFHLYHAFQAVFQTFGFNHNRYQKTIRVLALFYALFISGGFMTIPTYFMFFYK
ncbi:MAG: succinate dehydrogenase cytochrome b subunit [Bacteroidales bacterium]|nr:succinate dehydrogenase cytochrome b subunit [Bacteroidales bacterium]